MVERTDGLRLQVDFGHEQTALIHVWQVVKDRDDTADPTILSLSPFGLPRHGLPSCSSIMHPIWS